MKTKKIETKTDTISIKIPHNFTKQFDAIAKEEDRSRSSLMRKAFENFLEEYAEEKWAREAVARYKKDKSRSIPFERVLKNLNITRKELDEFEDDFKDCD